MTYYTYLDSDKSILLLFSQQYIILFDSLEDLHYEAEIKKIPFAGILSIDEDDLNCFIMKSAMSGNVVFYKNGDVYEKR